MIDVYPNLFSNDLRHVESLVCFDGIELQMVYLIDLEVYLDIKNPTIESRKVVNNKR